MRFYDSAYSLISESFRDLWEMGLEVKPKSYQNKNIEGVDSFVTKELQMYNYCLTNLPDPEILFLFEEAIAKTWCEAEFKERVDPGAGNPGKAWKIREKVWNEFRNPMTGQFDYTYSQRFNYVGGLEAVIDTLSNDPDSRQAWLPIFWPPDIHATGGRKRVPCSLGYHFMVREDQLDMVYVQRSADAVLHWGNDIYLAWLMKEYVAKRLGIKSGYLYHQIFSLHSYKRDWDKLSAGISNLATMTK